MVDESRQNRSRKRASPAVVEAGDTPGSVQAAPTKRKGAKPPALPPVPVTELAPPKLKPPRPKRKTKPKRSATSRTQDQTLRDPKLAEQVKSLAGQGTTPENAALVCGLSSDELQRIYAADWAQGLAIGEVKVQQVIFDQGVGRPAQLNPAGQVLRAEIKPNPQAAFFLQKQFSAQRRRKRVAASIHDVHPDQRPAGWQDTATTPAPVKRGRGRPKFSGKFTAALGKEICTRIMTGELLVDICRVQGMPDPSTVEVWAADEVTYPVFSLDFARAREVQIEALLAKGLRGLQNPGLTEIVTHRQGPEGDTVEVRTELNLPQAKAIADYTLKLAARIDAARARAGYGPGGGWEDDDEDEDRGPMEVTIRGGSPK